MVLAEKKSGHEKGGTVKLLSSQDEVLLLAVIKLGKDAYGVTIRRAVSEATGQNWSIGAIYDPLYRMEKRGFIESFLSVPTSERGGRSKRIFKITNLGVKALMESKLVKDGMWKAIGDLASTESR
jgi:PadR family transcriptional regulator PadR